jgi:hypothetical protein
MVSPAIYLLENIQTSFLGIYGRVDAINLFNIGLVLLIV